MKLTEYKNAFDGIEMSEESKRRMTGTVLQAANTAEIKTASAQKNKRELNFSLKKSLIAGVLAAVLLFSAIFIPLLLINNREDDPPVNRGGKAAVLRAVQSAQFTPDLMKILPESITANSNAAEIESVSDSAPANQASVDAFNSALESSPNTSGLIKIDVEDIDNKYYSGAIFGHTLENEELRFKDMIETTKLDKELAISGIEKCSSQNEWYVIAGNKSSANKLFDYTTINAGDLSDCSKISGYNSDWIGLILVKYSVSEDGVIEIFLHYIGNYPDISIKKRYVIYPDDIVEIFSEHDHNPKYFEEKYGHASIGYYNIPYLMNKRDSELFVVQDNVWFETRFYEDNVLHERKYADVTSYKKTEGNFTGLQMQITYDTIMAWDIDSSKYVAVDSPKVWESSVSFLSGNKNEYYCVSSAKSYWNEELLKGREALQSYTYSLYKDKKWFSAYIGMGYDIPKLIWVDGFAQYVYSDIQGLSFFFTHNNFSGIKSYYCDVNYTMYNIKYIETEDGEFYDAAEAPLFCGNNIDNFYDGGSYRSGLRTPFGDFDENGLWVGPRTAETYVTGERPLGSAESIEEFALSLIWFPDGITMDFAADLSILDKLPRIVKELALWDITDIINNPLELLEEVNQRFILDRFLDFDLDMTMIRDDIKKIR